MLKPLAVHGTLALLLAGCASSQSPTITEPPLPPGGNGLPGPVGNGEGLRLHIAGGNGQTGILQLPLPVPLRVLVTEDGIPKAGVEVRFEVVIGSGTLSDVPHTDESGSTRVQYRPLALGGHELVAGIVGSGADWVTFTAVGSYGSPVNSTFLSPRDEVAVVGTATPTAPAFGTWDRAGNATPGIRVVWTVTEGGGTLVNPDSLTGADGVARAIAWIVGSEPGSQRITVRVMETGEVSELHAIAIAAPGNLALLPSDPGA